uniref:Uncharacterized protein n=1 Tax=Cuerna arida TaxID=1464854 RepID=A0A1B6FKH2_9HEMI
MYSKINVATKTKSVKTSVQMRRLGTRLMISLLSTTLVLLDYGSSRRVSSSSLVARCGVGRMDRRTVAVSHNDRSYDCTVNPYEDKTSHSCINIRLSHSA